MSEDRRSHQAGSSGLIQSAGPLAVLGGLVLVLVAAIALREVGPLVVPVLFGLIIALTVWPLVGSLELRGVGHTIALGVSIVAVLATVVLAVLTAALSVGQLAAELPKYESQLGAAIPALRDVLTRFGIDADTGAITALISPEKAFTFVSDTASTVSGVGGDMFILAFTMIYALAGGTSFRARAAAAFGDDHPLVLGMAQFASDLRRYLIVRAELGIFSAVLSFVLLLALGVPFPLLWAMLVFVASFIPNIGGVIAILPPTILAYLDGGMTSAALVVIGYTVINFAQDQLLQPVVMGSELNLSPLVVFLAVVVWAWILGPGGALLAVPATVGLAMVLDAFPSSRGIAALMRTTVEPERTSIREAASPA